MKLETCPAGHFYNGDKFLKCPHCAAKKKRTQDRKQNHIITSRLRHTKRLSEAMKPVAGWMVCIHGNALGQDIRLHQGRNVFFHLLIDCDTTKNIATIRENTTNKAKRPLTKELSAGMLICIDTSKWKYVPFTNQGYW